LKDFQGRINKAVKAAQGEPGQAPFLTPRLISWFSTPGLKGFQGWINKAVKAAQGQEGGLPPLTLDLIISRRLLSG
jgi:hypothetical protein